MKFYYLHGFASGPGSFKAEYFKEFIKKKYKAELIIPDLNTPSFEEMTISSQFKMMSEIIEKDDDEIVLIGSSMGAFICLLLEEKFYTKIKSMLLLAPAFNFHSRLIERLSEKGIKEWQKSGELIVPHYAYKEDKKLYYSFFEDAKHYESKMFKISAKTLVFHGYNDETIPYTLTKKYLTKQNNIAIKYMNDDHSLSKSVLTISDYFYKSIINLEKR